VAVFGWTGGKLLVGGAYDDAKEKIADQKAQRAARRAARREEDKEGSLFHRHREDGSERSEEPEQETT
jgi:hypothetical protein